jgi:hypothetical protein
MVMARVLREGMVGSDVRAWQNFLVGQGSLEEEVSGTFDEPTVVATKLFQKMHLGLNDADGVVGNDTYGAAMRLGFVLLDDPDDTTQMGPNWPLVPDFRSMTLRDREAVFGHFDFKPAPIPSNPEGIQILGTWSRDNIVSVDLPQLANVHGRPAGAPVLFHKKAAQQLVDLLQAWDDAGLMPLVLSWDGSYAPRFVRGSRTTLSNHAWGMAFDINAEYNPLGVRPALMGRSGSVRQLVPLANEYGFWWGGHWGYPSVSSNRPDGMHFEVAKIL